MITLPAGSARNKIEFLAAFIAEQLAKFAPKPVSLLQNGQFFFDGAVANYGNSPFDRLKDVGAANGRKNHPGEAQGTGCQKSTFPMPYWNLHNWGASGDGDIRYAIEYGKSVVFPLGGYALKQALKVAGMARFALNTPALIPAHAKYSWSDAKYRLVVRMVLKGKGVLSLGNYGLNDGFAEGIHHLGGKLTDFAFDYPEETVVEFSTTEFDWEMSARDVVGVVVEPEVGAVIANFFEMALIEETGDYKEWQPIEHPTPDVGGFVFDINAYFVDVNVETKVMRYDLFPFDGASNYGSMSFACPRGAVNHFRFAMPSISSTGGGFSTPLGGVRIVGYDGRFLYLDYSQAVFPEGKAIADASAGEQIRGLAFKLIYSPEPIVSGFVGNAHLPDPVPTVYQPKATM